MIDSHLHVVDFLQRPMAVQEVREALDANGEGLVLFGLPVKKKWALSEPEKPTYYLDDNAPCGTYPLSDVLVAELVVQVEAALPVTRRGQLAPAICGFDPTDRLAADHVELMISRYDGWSGIGEVLLRHDDLTEITHGENARASHCALDGILDVCAQRGWPFTFHQDASSAGRSGQREYVGEVRAMLDRHPDVSQVWAHAGSSRRIEPDDHPALIAEMLDAHPALHIDLSWVVLDRIVVESKRIAPDWRDLILRHPERFVLGSDAFGSLDGLAGSIKQREQLLGGLPAKERDLLAVGNARRLWWHD